MARKEKSDKEIAAILDQSISDAKHVMDGQLAEERREVLQYYRGELPAPLSKGDSKYVSRDVYDAVDSMRATILEGFSASSRIVTFRPEVGETVDDAKQATEYCRHVFFKENDGEDILYDAQTEGLTKRLAVAKVYYKNEEEEEEYDFEGLTPDELALELEDHDNYEFKETDVSDSGLYSGTFTVRKDNSSVKVELIQPEDFMVSSHSANLGDARYCIHRMVKSRSDLLKEGYDKKLINKISFSDKADWDNYEKQERFDDVNGMGIEDNAFDDAGQEVYVYEFYIHIDLDGSKTNKLWKIVYADGTILEKEQVSRMPFASYVPLPIPHTYIGDNFAKSAVPVQNTRTILIRQIVNHARITNNPRTQVLNGTVQNPQELLDNRIGGIVNVRRMDGLAPIMQQPLNPYVFNLIQMIDEDKEEVTGISKLSQGLNKDAISSQNAEGMVEQLISASQQRQKIIARRFGKFIKELFHLIYDTARDYIDQPTFVEVSGVQAEVNPSLWDARAAATIELTLSYAELEREAQKWTEIDQYFSQDPMLKAAYGPDKRYEVVRRALESRGVEDIESILTPPDQVKPPEPGPMDKLALAEKQSQIEYQKAQAQAMISKAETDRMKAQAELMKVKMEAGATKEELMLDTRRLAHEIDLDKQELELAKKTDKERQSANFSVNPSG